MTRAIVAGMLASAMQTAPQGVTEATVLDNATVNVTRLRVAPGERKTVGDGTTSVVVISVDLGRPVFLEANKNQLAINNGPKPLDLLAIRIKPTRPPAPAAPATEAPPGITRTTLIDNADVRVVRVQFAPDGREPLHTHPNDLLTMQVTDGEVEIVAGADRSSALREAGFVQFIPRNVSHAYANADEKPFELLSVSIK